MVRGQRSLPPDPTRCFVMKRMDFVSVVTYDGAGRACQDMRAGGGGTGLGATARLDV